MNVLQLMRQARFEIDTVRASGSYSGLWTDEELLSSCNIAMDRTARLLRIAGSELLTKHMRSTDGATDFITEVYSPATGLRITANQSDYTLPPDFVSIAALRPTVAVSGFENVRFRPSAYHDPNWTEMKTIPTADLPNADNSDMVYAYVVQGRTLRIAPTPQDTFDVELAYHFRPARMRYYSTGTVQRTSGAVGVNGSGTAWLTYGLRELADLMVGVTATTGVTLDAHYPEILRFDTDTTLTLSRSATVTDAVGQSYTIAMKPALPEEHHTWLAQVVAANLLRKVDADLSAKMVVELGNQLLEQVLPEVTMRQMQESLVATCFEVWA